jgi:hypothetical protein
MIKSMLCWAVHLRDGKVFVPTNIQVVKGPLLQVEPVGVAECTDSVQIEALIKTVVARGNPVVTVSAEELRERYRNPVLLEYAKVKTWKIFEKNNIQWGITFKDSIYTINQLHKGDDGEWIEVQDKVEVLPPGSSVDEVARRVALQIREVNSKNIKCPPC